MLNKHLVFISYTLILIFLSFKNTFALNTIAEQAILFDMETNSVIFEKNSEDLMSPSSMSKLMTIYYIFKKIESGEVSLQDKFKVSKKAWKKGGSRMFINLNSLVTIDDLLKGIIVQSGNDACIAIAEGFSGSEELFAEELNDLAREIGLTNSNFKNSTGWPDPDHLMTSKDLLTLSIRTIKDFPDLYKLYAEKEFTYNSIRQVNRNPLLFSDKNADGLKTGHTSLGGYGLAASSERNGRRLILIINGLKSSKQRKLESKRLMDIGFFQYSNFKLFNKDEIIDNLYVWNGKKKKLPVYTPVDISITVPKKLRKSLKFFLEFYSPLSVPIKKDQKVARLILKNKNNEFLKDFPVFSYVEVEEMNFIKKIIFKFNYLIFGDSIYEEK